MDRMFQQRRWRRLDVPGTEEFTEDGLTFEGRVEVHEATPWWAHYRLVFDASWVTVAAEVALQRAGRSRQLVLRREVGGRWLAGDAELGRCRGALDVDLGMTPSTNTSAIRRLALTVGTSAELTATWVRFPELTVEPLH